MKSLSKGEWLEKILPLPIFIEMRADLLTLYKSVYDEYPEVQVYYSQYSTTDLKKKVWEQEIRARTYDPYEAVHKTRSLLSGLLRYVVVILIFLFIIGQLLGIALFVTVSRTSLLVTESISGVLISAVLGGSWVIGTLAGLLILLPYLLGFSSVMVKTINQNLSFGGKEITTRDERDLISYIIWNQSLQGATALRLLSIFGVLKLLSMIPGWNPYGFILNTTQKHIGAVVDSEGWKGALGAVYKSYSENSDVYDG